MVNKRDTVKEKRARLAIAYSKVFESEEGKIVLFDIMRVTGFDRTPFTPDPYEAAFNAGRQSIVHDIVRAMNLDLEKYLEVVSSSDKEKQGDFNV